MGCRKLTSNTHACVARSNGKYFVQVLRRVPGGMNLLASKLNCTKKQADRFVSKMKKELLTEKAGRPRRRTPYP